MEIIKVIVDDIPICCLGCRFRIYKTYITRPDRMECIAAEREIPDVYQRPEWCPFVLVGKGEE
jgi:hypothetical protein